MKLRCLCFFIFMTFSLSLSASDDVEIVAIGKATLLHEKLAIVLRPSSELTQSKKIEMMGQDFLNIIKNDFLFYKKYFDIFIPKISKLLPVAIDYDRWTDQNTDYLIFLDIKKYANGYEINIAAHNIKLKTSIYSKKLKFSILQRSLAHQISADIYKLMTNKPAMFNSKIVFVSDRTSVANSTKKELYIMDYDGFNKTRLTFHKGIVISPSISSDGTQILYSLIRPGKKSNVNLRLLNLNTKKDVLMSSRRGINSGAIFSTKEDIILLTLSHLGNAEIFEMNIVTRKLSRLTRHFSPDVDPSLNFDGSALTFLSGRSGQPMIYTMDLNQNKKRAKRIGYVGKFNATPRFSPDGSEIAFSSWMDRRFDIFRIGSNGKSLVRLTKDFGSNEDPTYSLDGEFIAFSSQKVISRKIAVHNIYIMDREGEIIGSISKNFGKCITPRWSK